MSCDTNCQRSSNIPIASRFSAPSIPLSLPNIYFLHSFTTRIRPSASLHTRLFVLFCSCSTLRAFWSAPHKPVLCRSFPDGSRLCRFGCSSLEDAHHLFVECHFFEHLRDKYSGLLVSDVDHMLTNTSLPNPLLSHLLHMVTHLFKDNVS